MEAFARQSLILFFIFALLNGSFSTCYSAVLGFEFNDPVGDATREHGTDVVRIWSVFDNTTGFYTTTLFAALDKPFEGRFNINLNVAIPDTIEYAEEQSYFFDTLNEFIDHPVSSMIILSGYDSSLLYWNVGDRVVLSSIPFGIPAASAPHAFLSDMTDYSTFWEASSDVFAQNDIAIIQAVPVPASVFCSSQGLFE